MNLAWLIQKCRMDALRKACEANEPPRADAAEVAETDAERIARMFHLLIRRKDDKAIKALTQRPTPDERKHCEGEMKAKKFWDADPHLLRDDEPISLPSLDKDVAMHSSRFWRDAFRLQCGRVGKVAAIGPVVNQFTFQDVSAVDLPNPSARALVELSGKCWDKPWNWLKQVTPSREREHPEIRSMTVLLTPHAEARVQTLAAADAVEDTKKVLRDIYEPVVSQVIASTTPGSPLRRRDANNHARALLNKKIRELIDEPAPSANAGTPATLPKREHGRAKTGRT